MTNQITNLSSKSPSNKLGRQLGLYSVAAAVAGVSMLALVEPAAGEVVVTKKTIPIPLGSRSMQEPVAISMANNDIDNFSFILSGGDTSRGLRELTIVSVDPGKGGAQNQVKIGGDFYAEALGLPRGAKIGPAPSFGSSGALVEGTNSGNGIFYSRGYWGGNPQNRYLGVRFQIKGKTHYGWIRLIVTSDVKLGKPTLAAKITAYAYETVADKPIFAGAAGVTAAETTAAVEAPASFQDQRGPSLGMLARGADAVAMWRSEDALTTK